MSEHPPRSDAAHLRVLVHPTRVRLLGLLREHGPQTASMLGAHVDEAPGTLSYHLSKLAEAGYIHEEERPGDRRQRWWSATHSATVWDDAELARDPDSLAASRDFSRAVMQEYARRFDAYLAGTPELGEDWVRAGMSTDRLLHLTAEQLQGLREDLLAVAAKWQAVSDTATPDAAQVTVVLQAYRSAP
ncbi:ArsR/SmtB family transcription factor [Microbacterium sp. GXF7504]